LGENHGKLAHERNLSTKIILAFKGDEAISFLKEKNNELDLMQEYLEDC
jgi:hypothetical protein